MVNGKRDSKMNSSALMRKRKIVKIMVAFFLELGSKK
jgi:hypothetical protein